MRAYSGTVPPMCAGLLRALSTPTETHVSDPCHHLSFSVQAKKHAARHRYVYSVVFHLAWLCNHAAVLHHMNTQRRHDCCEHRRVACCLHAGLVHARRLIPLQHTGEERQQLVVSKAHLRSLTQRGVYHHLLRVCVFVCAHVYQCVCVCAYACSIRPNWLALC